jgi:hypothetical protein
MTPTSGLLLVQSEDCMPSPQRRVPWPCMVASDISDFDCMFLAQQIVTGPNHIQQQHQNLHASEIVSGTTYPAPAKLSDFGCYISVVGSGSSATAGHAINSSGTFLFVLRRTHGEGYQELGCAAHEERVTELRESLRSISVCKVLSPS